MILSKEMKAEVITHADAMRELLTIHKVPRDVWNDVFHKFVPTLRKYPGADSDVNLHWIVGWFVGAGDALDCEIKELVIL
jgi:hypothetical protein